MRLLNVLLAAALAPGCVGCGGWLTVAPEFRPQPAPPDEARPPDGAPRHAVVALDVAVLEGPRGDAFLGGELWQRGDEQGVDLEVQPALEENGLRVCRLGGMLPARLQKMLSACPTPRRLHATPGKATPVPAGPAHRHLALQYRDPDGSRDLRLEKAQRFVEVTPAEGEGEDEGAMRLRFRPLVRHGRPVMEPKVARDPGGALRWSMEASEPTEEFPALAWELTVRPDEFVVLGARADRPGTFGAACFVRPEAQAVLVLRARPLSAGDEAPPATPSLAAQACLTPANRGN